MREGISSKPVLVKRLEISLRRHTERDTGGDGSKGGGDIEERRREGGEEDGVEGGKVWDTREMY